MTRRLLLLAALLAAAGCSSPEATSPSPPSYLPGVVLATPTEAGVEVQRVTRDRVAERVAVLAPPEGGWDAVTATVSAARVCALWTRFPAKQVVRCQDLDAWGGQVVEEADARQRFLLAPQLSPDGSRLAWVERPFAGSRDETERDQDLVVETLATGAQERSPLTRRQGGTTVGCSWSDVYGLAWSGEDALVLSCSDQSRVLQALPAVAPGTRLGGEPLELLSGGGDRLYGVRDARAVALDTRTGRVAEVVAVVGAGELVRAVYGGAAGVLYLTAPGGTDVMTAHLRLPGEPIGVPVTGVPSGLTVAHL